MGILDKLTQPGFKTQVVELTDEDKQRERDGAIMPPEPEATPPEQEAVPYTVQTPAEEVDVDDPFAAIDALLGGFGSAQETVQEATHTPDELMQAKMQHRIEVEETLHTATVEEPVVPKWSSDELNHAATAAEPVLSPLTEEELTALEALAEPEGDAHLQMDIDDMLGTSVLDGLVQPVVEPVVETVVETIPARVPTPKVKTPATAKVEFTPPEVTVETMRDMAAMRDYGTLVQLKTTKWNRHRVNKGATELVRSGVHAAIGSDIGQFRTNLLAGADSGLKMVNSAVEKGRNDHYRLTLPFNGSDHGRNTGPRILMNTQFFTYTQVMGAHKANIKNALDEFKRTYAQDVQKAMADLGSLADASLYPSVDEIKKAFTFDFVFDPIPEGGDFSNLPDDALEALAGATNDRIRKSLNTAMEDCWKRLFKVVELMVERLSVADTPKFHDSLVTNAIDVCDLLKDMNVTNDPDLEALRLEVQQRLCQTDAKELRKDDTVRKQVAADAAAILKKFNSL